MTIHIYHGITELFNADNGGWNLQLYYPTIRLDKTVGLQILIALFEFRIHTSSHAYAILICGFGFGIKYRPLILRTIIIDDK